MVSSTGNFSTASPETREKVINTVTDFSNPDYNDDESMTKIKDTLDTILESGTSDTPLILNDEENQAVSNTIDNIIDYSS